MVRVGTLLRTLAVQSRKGLHNMKFSSVLVSTLFLSLIACEPPMKEEIDDPLYEEMEGAANPPPKPINWMNKTCKEVKLERALRPNDPAAQAAWVNKQCCSFSATCGAYSWWELPGSGSVCDVANARCFEPCVAPSGQRVGNPNIYCGGNNPMMPSHSCPETGTPDQCTLTVSYAEYPAFYPQGRR